MNKGMKRILVLALTFVFSFGLMNIDNNSQNVNAMKMKKVGIDSSINVKYVKTKKKGKYKYKYYKKVSKMSQIDYWTKKRKYFRNYNTIKATYKKNKIIKTTITSKFQTKKNGKWKNVNNVQKHVFYNYKKKKPNKMKAYDGSKLLTFIDKKGGKWYRKSYYNNRLQSKDRTTYKEVKAEFRQIVSKMGYMG